MSKSKLQANTKPYRKVTKRRSKVPPMNHRKKLGPKCR